MDRRATSLARPMSEAAPLTRASRWIGAVVAVVAALVLLGWTFDVPALTSVAPGLVSMKVNAALCLGLLGLALARPRSWLVWSVVAVVLLVATATLVEYVVGVDLGIDELAVSDPGDTGGNPPGRMASATAVSAAFAAAALAVARTGRVRLSRVLATVPLTLGGLAILGYAYGVEPLYAVTEASAMAVHTSVLVVALALAHDLAHPGTAMRPALDDRGPVGTLLRTFGLLALVGLPALGYVRLLLRDRALIGDSFGVALMVIGGAGLLIAATLHSAHVLSVTVAEEAQTREALRELNESLEEGRDQAWRQVNELADQLAEERQHFSQSISRFDDLVWTVRVRDDEVDLVYASPNAVGLFGGEIHQTVDITRAMGEMVHPDDRHLNAAFGASMLAGEAAESQFRLIGYDGELRWLWVRGAPRTTDGVRYYDGITSNITERHQLAERVLELERERVSNLEQTQRMRDQFFAMAGHELRTPLAVAGGYLDLVLTERELEEEQRRYLEVVARSLRQAGVLVSDLFDLARLNAGIHRVEPEPVDLAALVRQAIDAQAPAAESAGLEITARLARLSGFHADPRRLLQVVDNLLSNAVKYTPRGGSVTVVLDEVEDGARLRVCDTGIGIPEDELPLVFDYLYRATSATATGIKGTGLGLALTKTLVEAHGGSIVVRPCEGPGAEFEVWLPRNPPDRTSAT